LYLRQRLRYSKKPHVYFVKHETPEQPFQFQDNPSGRSKVIIITVRVIMSATQNDEDTMQEK
jgi:hypothetical protein